MSDIRVGPVNDYCGECGGGNDGYGPVEHYRGCSHATAESPENPFVAARNAPAVSAPERVLSVEEAIHIEQRLRRAKDAGLNATMTDVAEGLAMCATVTTLRHQLAAAERERERLRLNLAEIAQSGVEHDDPRIGYVTVQIDRPLWDAMHQTLHSPRVPVTPTPENK